ncbi:hypothetical protein, partial [Streptomyces sp. NPDC059142]|uniref:hypothetical protein n=1 Tax=Streptomyces sp. NPDC059142 TaxID=3346739 RepID=UPI00368DD9F8
ARDHHTSEPAESRIGILRTLPRCGTYTGARTGRPMSAYRVPSRPLGPAAEGEDEGTLGMRGRPLVGDTVLLTFPEPGAGGPCGRGGRRLRNTVVAVATVLD